MRRSSARRRFVYLLADGLQATVIDSQVITVVRRMAERGIVFDLFIYQLRPPREERAEVRRRLAEVRRQVPGRVRFWGWPGPGALVRRPVDRAGTSVGHRSGRGRRERLLRAVRRAGLRLRALLVRALVLASLAPSLLRREIIIVHARGGSFDVALGLKRWYSGFRVLVDFRGDAPAEYLYDCARRGVPPDDREHARLEALDRRVLECADGIQYVSQALRRRLEQEHESAAGRGRVVPSLADEERFYFDAEARRRLRGELGLGERTVFVYSGSMIAWQAPEVVLRIFGRIKERLPGIHLLLLTPETRRARALTQGTGLAEGEDVSIRSARHEEVRAYLSASDVGLLLREPHPLNQVASPTKFAEYVLCGLPVLVSRGVGDLAELVDAHGLGVVLDSYEAPAEVDVKAEAVVRMARERRREERARAAARLFGLGPHLEDWAALYRSL